MKLRSTIYKAFYKLVTNINVLSKVKLFSTLNRKMSSATPFGTALNNFHNNILH